jgi:hypothetical protein
MHSTAGELEQKTKNYWRVSSIWNNRIDDELNVGDAITEVMETMKMNPSRPIFHSASKLMEELIEGQGLSNPDETKLLSFPDSADILAASMSINHN